MRVYHTTYDGFYVVVKDKDQLCAYEGKGLCPKDVLEWLKVNKPVEINEFYRDAIAYGYCK